MHTLARLIIITKLGSKGKTGQHKVSTHYSLRTNKIVILYTSRTPRFREIYASI